MSKTYGLKFGTGDPSTFSGLTPTFITFVSQGNTTFIGPTITEIGAVGIYTFPYAPSPTFAVFFTADGGSALADTDRYITGVLDPISIIDQRIGDTTDGFGSTSVDPSTMFGYLKRAQEFNEGNATFIKSTGIWSIFSRGSSALLAQKTLTNSTTSANKS